MPYTTKQGAKEIGRIISFFSGAAKIQGLPHIFLHEVLVEEAGTPVAIVIGFNEHVVEALFFDEAFDLEKPVFRSLKIFSIPLSDAYTGRIVSGIGAPLDEFGEIAGKPATVFKGAVAIIDREPVATPLSTGIKVVDATLPIGRGQRELIIGDIKLGKSALAVDAVLNQKYATPPVHCIYVLCGQKEEELRELIAAFKKEGAFLYSTIVAATAGSSFAEQYLAPFVGCTIGEYFRDNGKDALVIYDDLSKHAKTYRSISLLLERSPGREAYPGDIFSLHAGLLERAAKLSKEKGGGSLTALPIVETQENDITSFIPTNIISITDGQIYVQRSLFESGFIPAVNIGLSVSRVGSQAQPKLLRDVAGGIRLILAQHRELRKLSQLETNLSEQTQRNIRRGDLLLELLKQDKHTNVEWSEQVVLFYAVNNGLFDDIDKAQWYNFGTVLLSLMRGRYGAVLQRINGEVFDKETEDGIKNLVADFKNELQSL